MTQADTLATAVDVLLSQPGAIAQGLCTRP